MKGDGKRSLRLIASVLLVLNASGSATAAPDAKRITGFTDIAGWWVEPAPAPRGLELVIDDNGEMVMWITWGPNPKNSTLRLTDGRAFDDTPRNGLIITLHEGAGGRILRLMTTGLPDGKVETLELVPQAATTAPRDPPPVELKAEMVLVPAGEFTMGSDDGADWERPARRVYLSAFYIDKYEVTTNHYRLLLWATGRAAPIISMRWENFGGPAQPMVGVSWHDADAYCRWVSKRLPTEAEWEKAARGTDGRRYPWGDLWDASRLNSGESKLGRTVAVGSYPGDVSPWGVHDMAGNVREWVADWFGYYKSGPARDPRGPAAGIQKVLRGGSWSDGRVSTTSRMGAPPGGQDPRIGFRCAKSSQ